MDFVLNQFIKIPLIYSDARRFKHGIAFVEKNGKWGGVDNNGNERIPFVYTKVPYNKIISLFD